jgi:hypothetical protein
VCSGDEIFYAIYVHSSAHAVEYVCRRWQRTLNRMTTLDPGEPFARARTLEGVRGQLPAGVTNLGRDPDADPHLVEIWLFSGEIGP